MYLDNCPKQFRQQLERCIWQHVIPKEDEETAARSSINSVVRLLQQAHLVLDDERVSVDRVETTGSFGKKTCVQGDFDVYLVMFMNLPAACKTAVSVLDPDSTQESSCLKELRQQVYRSLQRGLLLGARIEMKSTAIGCRLQTEYKDLFVDVDVVLAPNLADAADHNSSKDRAVSQRTAVLRPLLVCC